MGLFDIFKSGEQLAKEKIVNDTGRELFRQIALFRDAAKVAGITNEDSVERFKHPYVAGYISGFINIQVKRLFITHNERGKYIEWIIEGIFPGHGLNYLKAKYEGRLLAGDNMNIDNEHAEGYANYVYSYDSGLEDGGSDVELWNSDKSYKPHKLFDCLMSGEPLQQFRSV